MPLDLTNPALKAFLRTLQITWQVPPFLRPSWSPHPNHQLLSTLPLTPPGAKKKLRLRLVDVSAVDASISRLIAATEREDRTALLREWVAFLGARGHLSTAGGDSPVGRQVMAIVMEEGRGVGLRGVEGGIVVLVEGEGGKEGREGDGEGKYDIEMMGREDEGVSEVIGDGGVGEAVPVDKVERTGDGEIADQDGSGAAEAPKDDGWGGGRGKAVPSGPPAAPQGGW
jgi:hypothetical protein